VNFPEPRCGEAEMLRLLVPLDGSACAERVLSHAFTLAHAFSASVRLPRVVPTDRRPDSAVRRFDRGLERRQSHLYLEPIAERFRNGGIPAEVVVEEGSPAAVITAAARSCADQLLVMATHGRGGAYEFPRGSVASKVLANYHDSVFLLRPQAAPSSGRYRRITAIVDLSTRSRAVVQSAARIAESQGAGLLIACALRTSELPAALRANPRAAALTAELAGLKQEAARAALRDYRESLPPAVPVETSTRVQNGAPERRTAAFPASHRQVGNPPTSTQVPAPQSTSAHASGSSIPPAA